MSVIASSTVQLTSSTFTGNRAHDTSSAIYALGTGTNTITNCTFSENVALVGSTISLLFADTTAENITMQNNECSADSCNIFVSFSTVNILDSTMTTTTYPGGQTSLLDALNNNNGASGYFLSISAGSTIIILNTDFSNGFASNGGLVYMSGNSEMIISGSSFTRGYANLNGGGIYASSFKTLYIINCNFVDNMAYNGGSAIFISSGTVRFESSSIIATPNYNAVYIVGGSYSSNDIQYSTGTELYLDNEDQILGAAIYSSNPESFSITNNTFTQLEYAYQGGAVYLTMTSAERATGIPTSPVCVIDTCTFTSNKATFGGALYVSGVNYVKVTNSSFTSNVAQKGTDGGNGGALYYSSSDQNSQIVFESGVTFNSNIADDSGGAVYWDYNQPINLTTPSYNGNRATLYGNNYGCFAQVLKSITSAVYYSQTTIRRHLSNATLSGSTSLALSDQQSGGQIQAIYLALFDEFDQIVGSDSTSTVTIAFSNDYSNETYTPSITGSTTVTVQKGVVKFDTIRLTAEPAQSYQLAFSTTGIDATKPSNANYLLNNSLSNTSMSFNVSLRA